MTDSAETPAAADDAGASSDAPVESTTAQAGATDTGEGTQGQDTETAAGASDASANSAEDASSAEDADSAASDADATGDSTAAGATEEEKGLLAKLPPELRKQYERHFTQKSQRIAAKARELESHSALIEALTTDPKGTVTQIAKQLGLQVAPPAAVDTAQNKLVELFGEDGAKALGPVLRDIVEESVAPIKKSHEETLQKAAFATAKAAHEKFVAAHPDYKKHEKSMVAMSKLIEAKPGMNENDYLETLYFLATRDKGVAAEAKKAINRMVKSATKSEPKSPAVPPSRVAPGPPRQFPTLQEAAEAARRGEVWADE